MTFLKKIKILFLFLFTFNAFAQENNCLHEVKKNETIIKILKNYQKYPIFGDKGSLKELMKLNKFKNINLIYPGQTVIIPKNNSDIGKKNNSIIHIVKINDTLSHILKKYNLFNTIGKEKSLKNTLELNPHITKHEKNGNLIYPNEIIYLNISQKFSAVCEQITETKSEISDNDNIDLVNEKEISDNDNIDLENKKEIPKNDNIDLENEKEIINLGNETPITKTEKNISSNSKNDNKLDIFSNLFLHAIESYQRIDIYDTLNNSNAALISKAGYGLALGWQQYLINSLSLGIKGKYQYISFKQFNSNNLNTNKLNISEYEINSNLNIYNFLNFSLFAVKKYFLYTYSTKINLNATTDNYNIIIESLPQYGFGFKTSFYYEPIHTFKIYGNFNYTSYLSQSTTNYNISAFNLYLYGLILEKKFNNLAANLEIDYSIAKQKTTYTNQKLQVLDIIIGATIEIK